VPVDLDKYREASLANWNKISVNWDAEREWIWGATGHVGERIVERADPQPGDTVLDIAAGTGDTGFIAARLIGSEGKLISTDFAQGMVDAARRIGGELGLDNVEYQVLDAEQMDLETDSVDKVVCRWGYMLMADPGKALAETRRVLKDGGRLAFSVWTTPEQNMWAAIPGMVLVGRGHLPPPEPGAPGIFALGDEARLREVVEGAGFENPEIEQVEVKWPYVDADEHWQFTLKLAGPLADAITQLPEEEQEDIRVEVRSKMEPVIAGGASGHVHLITAT
jgi:SAM-dependent methyltransferase